MNNKFSEETTHAMLTNKEQLELLKFKQEIRSVLGGMYFKKLALAFEKYKNQRTRVSHFMNVHSFDFEIYNDFKELVKRYNED